MKKARFSPPLQWHMLIHFWPFQPLVGDVQGRAPTSPNIHKTGQNHVFWHSAQRLGSECCRLGEDLTTVDPGKVNSILNHPPGCSFLSDGSTKGAVDAGGQPRGEQGSPWGPPGRRPPQ